MSRKRKNPTAPGKARMGSGSQITAAIDSPENTTTRLALKKIMARVAVSESVALLLAGHAIAVDRARPLEILIDGTECHRLVRVPTLNCHRSHLRLLQVSSSTSSTGRRGVTATSAA